MQAPIVPASDAIFGAVIYTNGRLAASPASDAAWNELHQHARDLIAAATTLRPLAPPDSDSGPWQQQSDALASAAAAVATAVEQRSLTGILDAGSSIYNTCTTCHAAYVAD